MSSGQPQKQAPNSQSVNDPKKQEPPKTQDQPKPQDTPKVQETPKAQQPTPRTQSEEKQKRQQEATMFERDQKKNQLGSTKEEDLNDYYDEYDEKDQQQGIIDEKALNSLSDIEKLRYLKQRQRKQERFITYLRDLNNKQRDELKNQAKELEKLVVQNVRKQLQQESKQQGPYNYLAEQQILKEITDKKKTTEDFKDIIEPQILDKLQQIQLQISKNIEIRAEIQSIKLKSKNLNYGDTIRNLNNQLTMKERQKKTQDDVQSKLTSSISEQTTLLGQLMKDYSYQDQLRELNDQHKIEKAKLHQIKRADIVSQKIYIQQQLVFSQLEDRYRKVSHKLGEWGNPMDLNIQDGSKPQKELKNGRDERIKFTPKDTEKAASALETELKKQFDADHNVQKEMIQTIKTIKVDISDQDRTKKQEIYDLQNKIDFKEGELKELRKQFREKEHFANIAISEMNKITRIVQKHVILRQSEFPLSSNFEQKGYKLEPKEQEIRSQGFARFSGGNLQNTDASITFDDTITSDWRNSNYQLVALTVFHQAQGIIYGIQGQFKNDQNELIDGPLNLTQLNNPDVIETSLQIKDGDYLKQVTGLFNDQICYLRFETNGKDVIEIGEFNDPKVQEFRFDLRKDQTPIGFFGVLDYSALTETPEDMYLVGLGIVVQLPPPRNKNKDNRDGDYVEERIVVSDSEDKAGTRKINLVAARKIRYKIKKNDNTSLLIVPSYASSIDPRDPHYQFQQKEKIRQEKIRLELTPHKTFKVESYKDKQYDSDEKRRRELSLIREKRIDEFRDQTRSLSMLSGMQPQKKTEEQILLKPKQVNNNISPKPAAK